MANGKNVLLDCGCSSLTIFHIAHVVNHPFVHSYRSTEQELCLRIHLGKPTELLLLSVWDCSGLSIPIVGRVVR